MLMFPDIVTFAAFKKRSNDYIKCLCINSRHQVLHVHLHFFYNFIFIFLMEIRCPLILLTISLGSTYQ